MRGRWIRWGLPLLLVAVGGAGAAMAATASTNAQGMATLQLPTGAYELTAWKLGYEDASPMTLEVNADLLIHVETAPTPEKDPDDDRVWM